MKATLKINLTNIRKNWEYLNKLSGKETETSAVLKANAYGLGISEIAPVLWEAGTRSFFVATFEEAIDLHKYLPKNRKIYVLNGYHEIYKSTVDSFSIIPVINSPAQLMSFLKHHSQEKVCLQLDIGMNRLGFQRHELEKFQKTIDSLNLDLIMGHLSCADEPKNPSNKSSLQYFSSRTNTWSRIRRSLSASHGILLGKQYNFQMTRPGIALYGGIRDENLLNTISVELPILQTHDLDPGDGVGYGLTFTAKRKTKVATLFGGYADGIMRSLSQKGNLYHGNEPCPILGRISMDLITVDITRLNIIPEGLTLLGKSQTINDLADMAGSIAHDVLTNLGSRFSRSYTN